MLLPAIPSLAGVPGVAGVGVGVGVRVGPITIVFVFVFLILSPVLGHSGHLRLILSGKSG